MDVPLGSGHLEAFDAALVGVTRGLHVRGCTNYRDKQVILSSAAMRLQRESIQPPDVKIVTKSENERVASPCGRNGCFEYSVLLVRLVEL